jgi:hypothetical protein
MYFLSLDPEDSTLQEVGLLLFCPCFLFLIIYNNNKSFLGTKCIS